MSNIILKLEDIYKFYKMGNVNIPVLNGISVDVKKGEWVSLLGSSGSGKTTLLNLIGTLEKPDKGDIVYYNYKYSKLSRNAKTKLRRNNIGFVFQFYHLLPELTVLENVKLAALLNGTNSNKADYKAQNLLKEVGLVNRKDHKPGQLSGGEHQRTAIARALINEPEVILADEPTGNLDSQTGKEIIEIFKKLYNEYLKTILMVTHDEEIALYGNRTFTIKDGIIEN